MNATVFRKNDPLAMCAAAVAFYLKLLFTPLGTIQIPFGTLTMFLLTGLLTYLGTLLAKWLVFYVAMRFNLAVLKRVLKIED